MVSQTATQRYREILKYHGLARGVRRVFDQVFQIDMYDWKNSTNTRVILSGDQFTNFVAEGQAASAMHYQPVYTAAVRNPLQHLVDKFPIVGASSTCFLDLGCGRGKALHVARSVLQHASLIGIDLHPNLLADAGRNLGLGVTGEERKIKIGGYIVDTPKIKLILNNVNDVSYDTVLSPYDAVIVFNKNSFDKHTTENTLAKIVSACRGKSVFYIYNNPVFEASFEKFPCVFEMTGWHKNWNTKVFKIY